MDFSLMERNLLWATKRVFDRSASQTAMIPDEIPAWLVYRGRLSLQIENELTDVKPGNWIFPKQGTGWVDFTEGMVLLSIRFRLRWPNGKDLFERTRSLVVRDKANETLRKAGEALVECYNRNQPPVLNKNPAVEPKPAVSPEDYFLRQVALDQWLETYVKVANQAGLTLRGPSENDPRLTRVRESLDAVPFAQGVVLQVLAAQANISLVQLNRRFKSEYGVTPHGYFERRRFAWVRRELVRGERTIKEIASDVGFKNLSQFSSWMTRLAGMSPRRYRQQVQM